MYREDALALGAPPSAADLVAFRAHCQVSLNLWNVQDALFTNTTPAFKRVFNEIDPMFGDGAVHCVMPALGRTHQPPGLQVSLPLFSVKWFQAQSVMPWVVSHRDFMMVDYNNVFVDDAGCAVAVALVTSTPEDLSTALGLPGPSSGVVRGQIIQCGYVLRQTQCDPPLADVHMVALVNPAGAIPHWVVNSVVAQQGLNLCRLREWLAGMPGAREPAPAPPSSLPSLEDELASLRAQPERALEEVAPRGECVHVTRAVATAAAGIARQSALLALACALASGTGLPDSVDLSSVFARAAPAQWVHAGQLIARVADTTQEYGAVHDAATARMAPNKRPTALALSGNHAAAIAGRLHSGLRAAGAQDVRKLSKVWGQLAALMGVKCSELAACATDGQAHVLLFQRPQAWERTVVPATWHNIAALGQRLYPDAGEALAAALPGLASSSWPILEAQFAARHVALLRRLDEPGACSGPPGASLFHRLRASTLAREAAELVYAPHEEGTDVAAEVRFFLFATMDIGQYFHGDGKLLARLGQRMGSEWCAAACCLRLQSVQPYLARALDGQQAETVPEQPVHAADAGSSLPMHSPAACPSLTVDISPMLQTMLACLQRGGVQPRDLEEVPMPALRAAPSKWAAVRHAAVGCCSALTVAAAISIAVGWVQGEPPAWSTWLRKHV